MIRGCMVDMDGTLLDSMPQWYQVEQSVLAEYGYPLDGAYCMRLIAEPGHVSRAVGAPADEIWRRYREEMRAHYEQDRVKAQQGALRFLQALREKGIPCWLVTASSCLPEAHQPLHKEGLLPHLDRVFSTRGMALQKDNPAFFAWLAGEMKIAPQELLVVEDQLDTISSARKAGCAVWGIHEPIHNRRTQIEPLCHRFAEDFDGLLPL